MNNLQNDCLFRALEVIMGNKFKESLMRYLSLHGWNGRDQVEIFEKCPLDKWLFANKMHLDVIVCCNEITYENKVKTVDEYSITPHSFGDKSGQCYPYHLVLKTTIRKTMEDNVTIGWKVEAGHFYSLSNEKYFNWMVLAINDPTTPSVELMLENLLREGVAGVVL